MADTAHERRNPTHTAIDLRLSDYAGANPTYLSGWLW